MSAFNELVNQRIKDLMDKPPKKTQKDIGDLLGMSQPSIHAKLNGDKTFEVEDLLKIARYFNVALGELLGEQEIEEKRPPQVLSPDDLMILMNNRHSEVMKSLTDITRLLKAGGRGSN